MDGEQKDGLFTSFLTFGSNVCNANKDASKDVSLAFLIGEMLHCVWEIC